MEPVAYSQCSNVSIELEIVMNILLFKFTKIMVEKKLLAEFYKFLLNVNS